MDAHTDRHESGGLTQQRNVIKQLKASNGRDSPLTISPWAYFNIDIEHKLGCKLTGFGLSFPEANFEPKIFVGFLTVGAEAAADFRLR